MMKWAAVIIKPETSRIWGKAGFDRSTKLEDFPIGTSVIAHDNTSKSGTVLFSTVLATVNDKGPYRFWRSSLEFLSPLEE